MALSPARRPKLWKHPMIEINLDLREFERKARQMGVFTTDQFPYAISRTLNGAVFDARRRITTVTWPGAMRVYNSRFINAAMQVEKSTKSVWTADLHDRLKRAHLAKHADGGTKQARGSLAIPVLGRLKRTASGVKPRPRQLESKIPKRALRVVKGKGIFEGRGGRLQLLYAFAPSAHIDKKFRFYQDFETVTTSSCARNFPVHLQHAVNTSFK